MPITYHWGGATGLRERIRAIVAAVTDVGRVYDYERFADDWATVIAMFKTTVDDVGHLQGWTIGLEGVDARPVAFGVPGNGNTEITYRARVRGMMALDDALGTQKTFEDLVLSVKAALDGDANLHQADMQAGASGKFDADLATAPIIEPRLFSDIVCHYAEIALVAREVV